MSDPVEQKGYWNGVKLRPGVNRSAMQWAWEQGKRLLDLGMKRGERDVLMAIAVHTKLDGGNEAWPSRPTICAMAGLEETRVRQCVANLHRAGVIRHTPRPRPQNHLYLIRPEINGHRWVTPSLSHSMTQSEYDLVRVDPLTQCALIPDSVRFDPGLSQGEQEKVTGEVEQENPTSELAAGRMDEPNSKNDEQETEDHESAEQPNQSPAKNPKRNLPMTNLPIQQGVTTTAGSMSPTPAQTSNPSPARPTPAQELANWFYAMIGSPKREAEAARTTWALILQPLLQGRELELVKQTMTWASQNEFWGDKLAYDHIDSAKKAVEKFAMWLTQRADEAEKAARGGNKLSAPPATAPTKYVPRPAWVPGPIVRKGAPRSDEPQPKQELPCFIRDSV
jgi:hypothetical protein